MTWLKKYWLGFKLEIFVTRFRLRNPKHFCAILVTLFTCGVQLRSSEIYTSRQVVVFTVWYTVRLQVLFKNGLHFPVTSRTKYLSGFKFISHYFPIDVNYPSRTARKMYPNQIVFLYKWPSGGDVQVISQIIVKTKEQCWTKEGTLEHTWDVDDVLPSSTTLCSRLHRKFLIYLCRSLLIP